MVFNGQREAPFLTNTFFKEDVLTKRSMIRVFWSWYNTENPDNKGEVVWEAPQNSRWYFGNTRALYKMYFTSQMKDPLETADDSACRRFAREFLPIVNEALADVHVQQSGRPAKWRRSRRRNDADSAGRICDWGINGRFVRTVRQRTIRPGIPAAKIRPQTNSQRQHPPHRSSPQSSGFAPHTVPTASHVRDG